MEGVVDFLGVIGAFEYVLIYILKELLGLYCGKYIGIRRTSRNRDWGRVRLLREWVLDREED